MNSFKRTAKSRLDEILSEDEDGSSPLTEADRIRLAAILAEPDDDCLARYSDVPGLAEPEDPLRPKTRDETYAKVRSILDAIPRRLEAEQFPQPDDAPPVFYSQEDDSFMQGFKCYMPEGDIKKKHGGGRGQSRGGYARRHGRPPDSINPAPNAPPPRTPPPATTTLCPPGAEEGVASPVDVLKDLPRNYFVALSGLSAAGNASPPTAKSEILKSSELSVPNPANFSS